MIRAICLSCLIFLLAACSDADEIPKDILPQEKIEPVLWDIIVADQFYRDYILKDSLLKPVKNERYKLYEEVFAFHKISRPVFEKSFRYYSEHPKLLKNLFDSLSASANKKVNEVYTPLKADTLKAQ